MENVALTVYERAFLFLQQERLKKRGIKAEITIIRKDGSEIRVPEGYNPTTE